MNLEQPLGKLIVKANGKEYSTDVEFWPGYGYVCPGAVTTNGDFQMLVNYIEQRLDPTQTLVHVPDFKASFVLRDGTIVEPGNVASAIRCAISGHEECDL